MLEREETGHDQPNVPGQQQLPDPAAAAAAAAAGNLHAAINWEAKSKLGDLGLESANEPGRTLTNQPIAKDRKKNLKGKQFKCKDGWNEICVELQRREDYGNSLQ